MPTILIATGNPSKLKEIRSVLEEAIGSNRLRILGLHDLPSVPPEPVEDGHTFADNARLKALYYGGLCGLAALADDSGLSVDALGGAPGVHSARYAGISGPRDVVDSANNRKLIAALAGVPDQRRTARYCCALALAADGAVRLEAQGQMDGRITDAARGTGGFGYDPHFFVSELGCTTAELSPEGKDRVSHRGRAVRELADGLRELLDNAPQLFI